MLANFPAGTPFLILAPETAGFADIARERADGVIDVRSLDAVAGAHDVLHATMPHVLLEGIDDLEDPVSFLAGLRARTPQARVFALISNAAHVASLGAFYAGRPLARAHPLVHEDIGPLFLAAGWQPLAIKSLIDESIPAAEALPFALKAGELEFQLREPKVLERGRTAAFLVIADQT